MQRLLVAMTIGPSLHWQCPSWPITASSIQFIKKIYYKVLEGRGLEGVEELEFNAHQEARVFEPMPATPNWSKYQTLYNPTITKRCDGFWHQTRNFCLGRRNAYISCLFDLKSWLQRYYKEMAKDTSRRSASSNYGTLKFINLVDGTEHCNIRTVGYRAKT